MFNPACTSQDNSSAVAYPPPLHPQHQQNFCSDGYLGTTTSSFNSSSGGGGGQHFQHQQVLANDSFSQQQQEQQQFAPSFLFGATQQPVNRRSFVATSPSRHMIPGFGSPGILKSREQQLLAANNSVAIGANKNVHWSPVLVRERSRSKSPAAVDDRKVKRLSNAGNKSTAISTLWNGPPLRSLNEDVIGPPEKQCRLDTPESHSISNATANSSIGSPFGQQSTVEPPEIVELGEAGAAEERAYWVTVFGFQPEQRDEILELFARHGDIMAQKYSANGNWVHIRYSSPVHVRQALAKNATIFQGQMIGVIPCKLDRAALLQEETAAAATSARTPIIAQSSASRSNHNASSLLNGSAMLEKDNSLLLNGSRLVPSTSAYKTAVTNSPLPSRARLSISSRAGMRPLNPSYVSIDGGANQSMDSSFQQQRSGGADDSFIGKLWNMFGSGGT